VPSFSRGRQSAASFYSINWLLAILLIATVKSAIAAPSAGFRIIQNEPFGAIATGIAGAIPLEISGSAGARYQARSAALQEGQINPADRARAEQLMRSLHFLGPNAQLTRIRIVAPVRNGALAVSHSIITPRVGGRSVATRVAPLKFQFQGFATDQQAQLQKFVQVVYPLMVQVYGNPAPQQQGKTVTVVSDANAGDGVYNLPDAKATTSGGEIDIAFDLRNPDSNYYNLTRQMLIAFHGPLIFGFDAWELGFSDAAALVTYYLVTGSPKDFDPSSMGVYLLPAYDFFNRPELGNPVFFASNTSVNLGYYRAGMAQSAWLKVYVENPNFFRQFNAIYYTQFNAITAGVPLAGNTPALKRIAATYAPTVEGLNFNDWYRRQYVLDTAITAGDKLWLGIVPLASFTSGDTRSFFGGIVQRYHTLPSGAETPLGGTGTITALDEKGRDITALSAELNHDKRVIFNSYGEAEIDKQNQPGTALPVVGFSNTGTPDQGRIALVVRVANAENVAYFPYGVAGTVDQPSAFYGATVGTDTGRIAIQNSGISSTVATLSRGAFATAAAVVYPSGPRVKTTFTLTPTDGGAPKTLYRNSAWAMASGQAQSLGVLLETAPGNSAFPLSVRPTATNRLRMISLPLFPIQTDEAAVLGVDPKKLLLARYWPNLAPYRTVSNGVVYGVTADKYELYPNISEPFAPGRGYWLNLAGNLSTTVRGGQPTRSQPYEVPLLAGWNQIGVPYNLTFSLNAIKVRLLNGTPVSYAAAVANGWISPGVWRWLPEGGYARVDSGDATNQRLLPFEGYFIYTRQPRGIKLVFNAASPTAAVVATRNLLWQLPIAAMAATARDADNAFGTVAVQKGQPLVMPAAKPPAATRALTLSFLSGGTPAADATGAGAESGWAESLVAPFTSTASWSFIVDGATAGETMRLEWGDPSRIAAAINLTLVDEAIGQRVAMINANHVQSYSFVAGTSARHFHIEATVLPPAIANLTANPLVGSHSATIAAKLGVGGTAQVEIQTSGGETVTVLAQEQPVQPGTTHWMWNGRNAQGHSVAAGHYVARVKLTDERSVEYERSLSFDLP